MKPAQVYEEMVRVSEEKGWPEMYEADLTTHDRVRIMGDDPPPVFAWVLRDMGTLLLDLRMQQETLRDYFHHLDGCNPKRHVYYTFDGKRLSKAKDLSSFKRKCLDLLKPDPELNRKWY